MQYTAGMPTETYQEIIQRNLRTDPDTGQIESWRVCVARMASAAAVLPGVRAELTEARKDIDRITERCRKEEAAHRRARRILVKMGTWVFVLGLLGFGGWAWALYLSVRSVE